ncbi:hypothetical protein P3T76_015312 [Phytophthora citrophthora]|uniref:Uncharacterized protein n=1 Tax=Phytophthora citrophthora TaxID=4793 RepID=A0AAD9LBI2_9STRA|nr:hypothetical protein P3T76_015312 [Phytophthora citrophthora]
MKRLPTSNRKAIAKLAPRRHKGQMEVAPAHPIDIIESVVNEKEPQDVNTIEAAGNNHTEVSSSIKTHEPEVVCVPVEEKRPADANVAPSGGDAVVLEAPASSRVSESAEVVTPAGTVEVETPHCPTDTSPTEAVEKVVVVPTIKRVEDEIPVNTVESKAVEEPEDEKTEQSFDQHEVSTPVQQSAEDMEVKLENTPTQSSESAPTDSASASAPSSPSKKAKSEKKNSNSDSFASDEMLAEVRWQTCNLIELYWSPFSLRRLLKTAAARTPKKSMSVSRSRKQHHLTMHTNLLHSVVVEAHLNEKQRKRYVAALVERVVQNLTQETTAKGEDVSIEVQSNICLIEQMFLTLGRRSPLQDMYTAEEEEMLDLLFHSNSSDNLPING